PDIPRGRPTRLAQARAALPVDWDGKSASPTGAPLTPGPPRPLAPPPWRDALPAPKRADPSTLALGASWCAGRSAATKSPRRGVAGLGRSPPRVRPRSLQSAGDLARAG